MAKVGMIPCQKADDDGDGIPVLLAETKTARLARIAMTDTRNFMVFSSVKRFL